VDELHGHRSFSGGGGAAFAAGIVCWAKIAGSGDAMAYVIADADRVPVRCVLVDDSPLFLEGATDLLEREGLEVVGAASNSAEAIRLVEELQRM
jgi:phosphoribosylamine-glycine ligase